MAIIYIKSNQGGRFITGYMFEAFGKSMHESQRTHVPPVHGVRFILYPP